MKIKISQKLKKLFREDRHLGERPYAEIDWFTKHIGYKIDPIVEEVIKENKIDIYPVYPYLMFNRDVLFETLLISTHPVINESIKKLREKLDIRTLYPYEKELVFNDDTGDEYFIIKPTEEVDSLVKEELNQHLDIFFAETGKKIFKTTWKIPLARRILTGILPMPDYPPEERFRIVQNYKANSPYPALVLKRRIDKRELNPLITFIREHEDELVKATKNLPDYLIKRSDADLNKLAIGLWIYKNEYKGTRWMLDWIKGKYETDEKFFGKYDYLSGKEVFPNFKSDALSYLEQIIPLTS